MNEPKISEAENGVPEAASTPIRPEELPPVEAPSAGYIIQLFLIPALIVAAVIGVWALFGMLANEETDAQQLVADLGSSNEHRRWRAALGLAQVLRNQQIAPDTNGQPLAEQPHVVEALTNLLSESLSSVSTSDEEVKHQEFLARTMGSLRADDDVLPVLGKAISPDKNIEVRKSGLMSLAMIAGRHFEIAANGGKPLKQRDPDRIYTLDEPLEEPTIRNAEVLEQLKLAAQDEAPGIRHLAAFVLGLVSGDSSIRQLNVLLLDADEMAQANAAVALARNGSTSGVATLIALIENASADMNRDEFAKLSEAEQQAQLKKRQFEQPVILSNSLRAIESLLDRMSDDERNHAREAIANLLKTNQPQNIKMQAQQILAL